MVEHKLIIFLQQNLTPIGFLKMYTRLFDLPVYLVWSWAMYLNKMITLADVMYLWTGGLLVMLLKRIFTRPRPYQKHEQINNLSGKKHRDPSFPSGHTFMAFLSTRLLLTYYPDSYLLRITPYLIAFSRVCLGVHYLSDVVGGALLARMYWELR